MTIWQGKMFLLSHNSVTLRFFTSLVGGVTDSDVLLQNSILIFMDIYFFVAVIRIDRKVRVNRSRGLRLVFTLPVEEPAVMSFILAR